VIAVCFGSCAPDALPAPGPVVSHDFKKFERLAKLATSSYVDHAVSHCKKVMHRVWAYFHARLAFTMAAFNVLSNGMAYPLMRRVLYLSSSLS
jgi:hypothetical protein